MVLWLRTALPVLARGVWAGVASGALTGFLVATLLLPPFGGLVGVWFGVAVGAAVTVVAAPLLALAHRFIRGAVEARVAAAGASILALTCWTLRLGGWGGTFFLLVLLSAVVGAVIGRYVVLGPRQGDQPQ